MIRLQYYIVYVLLFFVALSSAFAQQKPNIVIIVSDDHAYQTISAYGSKYGKTPNIDRIAHEGAIVENMYVNNSICGPARATLLTGKYSHKNGFKDNETSNFDFNQPSFVKDLQKSGYNTAWVGKIHLGHELQGFDYYDILVGQGHYFNPDFISKEGRRREEGYVSDLVTTKALNWMEKVKDDSPFCLIIGHKATHRTWMPDPKDFGRYDTVNFELPNTFYDKYEGRVSAANQEMTIARHMLLPYDLKMYPTKEALLSDGNFKRMNKEHQKAYTDYYLPIYEELEKSRLEGNKLAEWKYRRYMMDYLNTAASMDRNIGEVLDYLDKSGLKDNTIVIYLSDQGFYMGEHGWFDKRFMYEESFRTPMVICYPKLISPASKIKARLINVDIAPTILDLAGVNIRKDMQGKSFKSVLSKPNKSHRENIYYHYYENGEHAVSPHFGVFDGRYKLIRFYKRTDQWELFDLHQDPNELKNVYTDKKYAKIVSKMKKQLIDEIKNFEDEEAFEIFNQQID